MKRGRAEEVQFGQPRNPTAAQPHRITTTSTPGGGGVVGNPVGNVTAGSTIQYQLTNVLKHTTAAGTTVEATNLSATNAGGGTTAQHIQTVQYSTGKQQQQQQQQQPKMIEVSELARCSIIPAAYTTPMASNLSSKPGGVAAQTVPPQSGQVYVLNSGIATAASAATTVSATNRHNKQQTTQMAPTPMTPGATPLAPQAAGNAQFQRLKVEDALSYLDEVKFKFGNQPQVYNDFLDIMKEFKSQSIDTPGVIQRVSTLFKGHPQLIVGFNTFLPPGYKIEVSATDKEYQVSVSMPSPSGGTSVGGGSQPSPPQRMQIIQTSTTANTSGMHLSSSVNLMPHQIATAAAAGGHSNQGPTIHAIQQTPLQQQQSASSSSNNNNNNSNSTTNNNNSGATVMPISSGNFSRERTISSSSSAASGIQAVSSTNLTNIPSSQNNVVTGINAAPMQRQPQQINDSAAAIAANLGGMHRLSAAHQMMQNEAIGAAPQNQPVEFNHAITYVNKIKNRFQSQPEKYKRFLEILHTYQKEQKVSKEGSGTKQLTEAEVYAQVAKLFDNQEDLLREFGQFLPDATAHPNQFTMSQKHVHNEHKKLLAGFPSPHPSAQKSAAAVGGTAQPPSFNNNSLQNNLSMRIDRRDTKEFHEDKEYHPARDKEGGGRNHITNQKYGSAGGAAVKRSPSFNALPPMINNRGGGAGSDRDGQPPPKKHKPVCKDISLAEASRFGTLNDFAFFDKVRKALRSPEVYDNFLRCLTLYNQEILSKMELNMIISPFLVKFPDLLKWFLDFIGPSPNTATPEGVPMATAQRQERTQSEMMQEIDLSTCKRLGASYCALPKPSELKKCSGRTALCKEVLNDTWVSFPTWAEDSTFVTSRKTQYEEFIYRCEDERFELDVVIETNSSTIRVLEGVHKKIQRMTPEEAARFRLDDCLGGTSPTIHQRALRRIYGEKYIDIVQGLKKNPVVAVPVVLRRLKAKEEEWREAQKNFNKQWREQNEKYYLKSLDHQGINFKQNDIKALRSKSLFNEIETLYDERHEQNEEGTIEPITGPHLTLQYKDKTILDDAANLLIHHVKRQTGAQKQEKQRIKHILRQFVPDLFFAPRQQMSDDERDDGDDKDTDGDNADDAKSTTSSTRQLRTMTSSSTINDDIKENVAAVHKSRSGSPAVTSSTTQSSSAAVVTVPDSSSSSSSTCVKNETNNEHEGSSSSIINNNNSSKQPQQCNLRKSSSANSLNSGGGDVTMTDLSQNNEIKMEIKEEKDRETPSPNSGALPQHAVSNHTEEAYTLFFANNNWYLFLRLHAILCERLRTMYDRAQILLAEENKNRQNRRESTAVALRLKPKNEIQVEDFYPTFLDMLKNVLDGNLEANSYEDSLREMFGIHAYIAFTLDRVVQNAVRQLQHCVTERGALECVELFHTEQKKLGAGGLCRTASKRLSAELAYQRKAEAALQDENCFKIYFYKIDCRVTIELLDSETEESSTVTNVQNWSNYCERLANPGSTSANAGSGGGDNLEIKTENPDDDATPIVPRKALFLPRNVRNFRAKNSINSTATNNTSTNSIVPPSTLTLEKSSNDVITTTTTTTMETSSSTTLSSSTTTTLLEERLNSEADASVTSVTSSTTTTTTSAVAEKTIFNSTKEFWGAIDGGKKSSTPQRIGLQSENYYVDDRQQVQINLNSYKMVFAKGHLHFFKKNSLRRARQTHQSITKIKHKKFTKFLQSWVEKNVTDSQKTQTSDWLLGRNTNDLISNITIIKQETNLSKTPYFVYNRYKVEKMDS